ncbi:MULTISPECIES: zinc ABC transporter substrate-binding protein [Actibacterium]|uniref:High-affinity zinc uptake system protein ZnuA n=1 Tax=Actibacterium naphthalenivorans TaxID=1614693 RepID=A0A840CL12_9RHOB|nr:MULTISPECIES: zinc ABC transporter substrate-binding protein [Actibacterium]ALG91029.1 hypothetical protein TQ29_13605 [Actibacterium sp. EMB200-NS6]MBB4023416.1 zinc transport system substrate-binding protein [Actibacterium naphthalenivorans]
MRLPISLVTMLLSTPALADAPAVVTDIPPVHSLAAQVMGDLGTPVLLLDKGSDPHHFQLKPSQARALSDADLVFWVGPELTPWLERALDGIGPKGKAVELIELTGLTLHHFGEEHAHEVEHAAEEDHAGDGGGDHMAKEEHDHDHDHDGLDPHAWLDPHNARLWATYMADALAQADPENAATYAANAAAALAGIDRTEAEVRQTLAPVSGRPIVVFHDAYTYFAEAFDVTIAGAVTVGDAASPGAARLRAIRQELGDDGAVCIFPEVQHDPAYIGAVIEGSGVRLGGALDPSGSSLQPGPGLYADLMTGLARTIADCATQE